MARIPPKFAGLGELVSVLPVIAASVLLHFFQELGLQWPNRTLEIGGFVVGVDSTERGERRML